MLNDQVSINTNMFRNIHIYWHNEQLKTYLIKNNIFVYGDYSYISEEANEFLKRSEIRGDDIVIAITGDIGKVGLVPRKIKKANINQHLARIRIIKNAIPYFVFSFLCSN